MRYRWPIAARVPRGGVHRRLHERAVLPAIGARPDRHLEPAARHRKPRSITRRPPSRCARSCATVLDDPRVREHRARAAAQRELSLVREPRAPLRGVERLRHARVLDAAAAMVFRLRRLRELPRLLRQGRRRRIRRRRLGGRATTCTSAACRRIRCSAISPIRSSILSSTIRAPQLARLIFHELAHQVVYVRDDSVFNESFAVTVEQEGSRRWLERYGTDADRLAYEQVTQRRAAVRGADRDATANGWTRCTGRGSRREAMRARKAALFAGDALGLRDG